jgi:hypothetical protein
MKFASTIVEDYYKTFFPVSTAPKDGTLIKGLIALDDLIVVIPSLYWDIRQNGWFVDRGRHPVDLVKWTHLDALVADLYHEGGIRH